MEIFHIFVLALIQGITEFLPISSSAHLILPQGLLGWPDQGLAFDVAVHVGTLAAVVAYFHKDIVNLLTAWINSSFHKVHTDDSRLAWYVIIATIPAGLAGLAFGGFIEEYMRTTYVIAVTTIGFGLILGWADRPSIQSIENLAQMTLGMVLIIGFAQALALIPGTSRSGITITAALLCGLHRQSAARFSFLLSIPLILLSGGYKTWQLLQEPTVAWFDLALGAIIAGISAFICIHYFLHFINRIGMLPFVIYRLWLGAFLLVWYLM